LGSCKTKEDSKRVTVYVSADDHIARIIFDSFTEKTGIEVDWVGDSESSKNTVLVQRLLREKERPIADVFWSSEILGTIKIANKGLFAPCRTSITNNWPAQFRDARYRWFAFSPRARVIAYNPSVTKLEDMPKTWWEYGDAAMADPRFGTTYTHVAVMSCFPERSTQFFESIKRMSFLGGNAATVQAVVDGIVQYAMTDSDDVYAAIERGKEIAMFMPRHHENKGGGTLLIPNTVGIIDGCSQPALAEEFVLYLLSDDVATILAKSTSRNIPIQPAVALQFPELAVYDPLEVDFYKAESLISDHGATLFGDVSK